MSEIAKRIEEIDSYREKGLSSEEAETLMYLENVKKNVKLTTEEESRRKKLTQKLE